jgi:hypothetical protein
MLCILYAHEVEQALGVSVLRHTVKKPGGGDALLKRFERVAKPHQIAMAGDRLFTDVLFGNLNGTVTILTRNIISEKGDNAVAAKVPYDSKNLSMSKLDFTDFIFQIRRFEHRLLEILQNRKVSPPDISIGDDKRA